jgi:HK97 family phage major capsid protein
MHTKHLMWTVARMHYMLVSQNKFLPQVVFDIDEKQLMSTVNEIKNSAQKLGDEVKKTAEEALKEAKNAGSLGAETKATADKLLTAHKETTDKLDKLIKQLEALDTKSSELEQKIERSGKKEDERKSLGEHVVNHASLEAFRKAGSSGRVMITVKNAITSAPNSAGPIIFSERETGIIPLPRRELRIRQLLTQGRTNSNLIEYVKKLGFTNNAAVVSEGAQKPESTITFESADAAVRTIAHWIYVSRQAMDDAPQLQSEIDSDLRYGLDYAEEVELLNGDGTGQHLSGLIPNATAFARAFVPANKTIIDDLRLALLQASLAEFPADGIVLHPEDWARIELTKDGQQLYIYSTPSALTPPRIWGQPVVATQAMDPGDFLVGAFRTAATIYDRMDTEVLISSEDRDNFIKNMLTVRAEKRLALAVKRPQAIIYGQFDNQTG